LRWDLIRCSDAEEDDYICNILHKVDMLQEENNTFDVSAVDRSLQDIRDDTTNDMEESESSTVSPLTSSDVGSTEDSQVSEPIDSDTETLVVFESADIKFRISGNKIGFIKIKIPRTLLYSVHNIGPDAFGPSFNQGELLKNHRNTSLAFFDTIEVLVLQ
jgi:hypothetical protein